MSCGDPHELDCQEALNHLYEFLDGEITPDSHDQISHHLHECGPCLQEYDVERIVKSIVARSCAEVAPAQLKTRLMAQLGIAHNQAQPTDRL